MNPTKSEAVSIMQRFDKGITDNRLDFEECKELVKDSWKLKGHRDLVTAFRALDRNCMKSYTYYIFLSQTS